MSGTPDDRPVRRFLPRAGDEPDAEASVDWEIEHYLAERVDRLVAAGWDPEAARREAERRFGPRERYRPEMTRIERRRMRMMTMGRGIDFVRGVLGATLRTIRRYPGFALGVVLTLGLGVGANAAMFGIVDRLLLRPPDGIVDADQVRLVGLTRDFGSGASTQRSLTYPDLLDLEEHSGIAGVSPYGYGREVTVGTGPEAVSLKARSVGHDFFQLLGATPALGRFFTAEEDRIGAPPTAVLSWEWWRRAQGEDPGVLGRTLEVAGTAYTIIGVAPKGFTGVTLEPVDLWLPIEPAEALITGSSDWRESRQQWWVSGVVRLADGVALATAEEQATRLVRAAGGDATQQARREEEKAGIVFEPLTAASDTQQGRVVRWLVGVSAIVLIIACANVANLLLARGARRRREVAVRLAMGVSRPRLIAEMSAEAVLLAGLGGLFAVALARWGGDVLRSALLPDVLFPDPVGGRVLAFTAAVSLLAGLLAGVGPALQTSRADLASAMSEQSRGTTATRSRTRGLLVLAQAALSVLLLVGAGLFVQSLERIRSLDLGVDVDRLLMVRLETATPDLPGTERAEIHRQAAAHVARMPGVEAVTYTNAPLGWGFAQPLRVPGLDSIPRMPGGGPYYWAVSPDYFRAVGLGVVEGRALGASDLEGAAPVAVVSRTMADTLWTGSAVGQCLLVGPAAETCTTVVGVVEDASRGGLEDEPFLAYYLPLEQTRQAANGLYVRTAGPPQELAGEVALALRSFSPQVRFARVQTVREFFDPQARSWSLGATMFSIFGALALIVAAVGLYSLLAFDVAERRRELGIRIALGAARGRVLRGIVASASRLIVGGIALGLVAAWVLAPRVEELLFEVSPRDPLILGGVSALLACVALAATIVPARRATRVDPMEALRAE